MVAAADARRRDFVFMGQLKMNVALIKAAPLSRGLSAGGKKDDLMLRLETAINAERASGAVFVIPEELSSVRATFEARP